MRLIDEKAEIAGVAAAWKEQYCQKDGTWGSFSRSDGRSKQDVYQGLLALGQNATREDVAAVIGNDGWICANKCSEPGCLLEAIVQIGEEPDYESSTAYLCRECFDKLVALVARKTEEC